MQHLHSEGNLRSLRRLTLDLACANFPARDRFGQGAICMAGLWQLQYCYLRGYFDCLAAIQYLPVTLQHVILEPIDSLDTYYHTKIQLSRFSRFTVLQSPELYFTSGPLLETGEPFYELGTTFPVLTHLYLDKQLCLKLLTGQCISQCLPQVQHIVACIDAHEANRLMTLSTLLYIGLTLLPAYGQRIVLKVEETSHLIKVVIHGPAGVDCNILVDVQKTGTHIDVRNASTRILNNNDYHTEFAPEL